MWRKWNSWASVRDAAQKELEKYPEFNSGHTYENRTNVVAAFTGSGGGRSLILNGHMDTVSPGERSKWRSDPFAPRLENGRLYGLGSADMKSGLAAMVCALEILYKNGYRPKGDIFFQSVVDEEAGGGNSRVISLSVPITGQSPSFWPKVTAICLISSLIRSRMRLLPVKCSRAKYGCVWKQQRKRGFIQAAT